MNPINYLKEVNLPPEQYLVVGSALLAVKEIRPLNDIDLLVSPELFSELITKRGWEFDEVNINNTVIDRASSGIIEAFISFRGLDLFEWKENAAIEIIDGISFLALDEVLEIKKQWKRPKDQKT